MQESSWNTANKRMMVMPHNYYNNQESQLLLSSSSSCGFHIGGGGGGGRAGSMFCNTSSQVACMSDIYDVAGADSGSGSGTNNSAAAVLVSKSLTDPFFHFNSSSGEMAAAAVNVNVNVNANANVRIPFTSDQLQELERQTLIYKYMLASAPIPPELLLPMTKSLSRVSSYQPSMMQGSVELKLLSNNSLDQEPWRCRRTDGKKWRCSRDVVPDQKYCERHCHKSRPRSRKPVELQAQRINNKKNRSADTLNKSHFVNQNMASSVASSEKPPPPRGLEWFMNGETTTVASNSNHQEWPQNSSKYDEHHREHLMVNSNSYYYNLGGDDLAFQAQRLHDQYSLCLSPKTVSPRAQTLETRHFIDSWSIRGGDIANEDGIGNNCFVSPNEKLPLSSLALSMSAGGETIERNENALMGCLATMCSERPSAGTLRTPSMNRVSGISTPPGGPLAEALCLGIASSVLPDSDAPSPHGCSTSITTSS